MTGPEHYHAAEECIEASEQEEYGSAACAYWIQRGQLEAMLALAAATALRTTDLGEWMEVAGPAPDRWYDKRPDPEEPDPPAVNGFAIGRQP